MCENGVDRCPLEEEDLDFIEILPDGTRRPGLRVTLCDGCIEQIRAGYRCIGCSLRSEEAFPAACRWCGYGMKERQAQDFGELYAGWRDTRGQIRWDEELARLEKQKFERELAQGLRNKGVVLPRSVG